MSNQSKVWREELLKMVDCNVALIPEEMVERDYITDSLLNKAFHESRILSSPSKRPFGVVRELETLFRNIFGFPYVIPVSQGRLAEALLSRLLLRNGHTVPGSALFPTTRVHQQLNGATPLELMSQAAYNRESDEQFKGNLDLERLEEAIETCGARWIPMICVEPCNNAIGGHPVSMKNMRAVNQISKKHGIPVYLDACRIISNALLIKEREAEYGDTSVTEILLEFCSYADGCTMSATKDFPTPIGGFFATRDESLYHQAMDLVIGFGSGLSYENKRLLCAALIYQEEVYELVNTRATLVKLLHGSLASVFPLIKPCSAHGVFVDLNRLELDIPPEFHPGKSFLYSIFKETGIRAGENPQSIEQEKRNEQLLRFAVPIIGETEKSINATASALIQHLRTGSNSEGLEKIGEPPGLTGPMRARYRVVKISSP